MVYEVFVRKGKGQVINELYKTKEKAIKRFSDLADKFPTVCLTKKRKNQFCGGIWK